MYNHDLFFWLLKNIATVNVNNDIRIKKTIKTQLPSEKTEKVHPIRNTSRK